MPYGDKPFGLRQIVVTTIDGATQAALPVARTLGYQERLVQNEMRGDDIVQSVVAIVDAVEFSLEAGGIGLDAWAIMTGRTVAVSGSTPNEQSTYNIAGGQCYPYFKVYGKSVGENRADDIHILLFKCKITSPIQGQFQDSEFFIMSCDGIAINDGANGIADLVQHETAVDLPSS
jgi:hypothetical protein